MLHGKCTVWNEKGQLESEEADKETETRLQILFDDGNKIEDTIDNKNNLVTQINDYLTE